MKRIYKLSIVFLFALMLTLILVGCKGKNKTKTRTNTNRTTQNTNKSTTKSYSTTEDKANRYNVNINCNIEKVYVSFEYEIEQHKYRELDITKPIREGTKIRVSIDNKSYNTIILDAYMGNDLIDSCDITKNKLVYLDDFSLSNDYYLNIKLSDKVNVTLNNDDNLTFSAYYFDDDNNKITKNTNFYLPRGKEVFFSAKTTYEDNICAYIETNDSIIDAIYLNGTDNEKDFNAGIVLNSDASLEFFSYNNNYVVSFESIVDDAIIEVKDFSTNNYIESGDEVLPLTYVLIEITNNTSKVILEQYNDKEELLKLYVIDKPTFVVKKLINSNNSFKLVEYKANKVNVEIVDNKDVLSSIFYDYNDESRIINNNDYIPTNSFIYFNINNYTEYDLYLCIKDSNNTIIKDKYIHQGRDYYYSFYITVDVNISLTLLNVSTDFRLDLPNVNNIEFKVKDDLGNIYNDNDILEEGVELIIEIQNNESYRIDFVISDDYGFEYDYISLSSGKKGTITVRVYSDICVLMAK